MIGEHAAEHGGDEHRGLVLPGAEGDQCGPGAEAGEAPADAEHDAAGDEPQVESAITIVLTDKSGNKSGNLSGKSLTFDFLAPSIDKVTVDEVEFE